MESLKTVQKRRYDNLVSLGICTSCGHSPAGTTVFCEPCRVRDRARRKKPPHPCDGCGEPCQRRGKISYCIRCNTKKCPECNLEYKAKRDNRGEVYCSNACRGKAQSRERGESARNWRGGKVAERKAFRGRIEYKQWRDAVYRRDDWTCQDCGLRNGNGKAVCLHAHHIKRFSQYPELRLEISNGITLCKPCHERRHTKHGRRSRKRKGLGD